MLTCGTCAPCRARRLLGGWGGRGRELDSLTFRGRVGGERREESRIGVWGGRRFVWGEGIGRGNDVVQEILS